MAEQSQKSSDKARSRKTLIYTAIGATVIVAGGAAYLWFTRAKPQTDTQPGGESEPADTIPAELPVRNPPAHALPEPTTGFPLKKGSKGPLVIALQKLLNSRFKSGLVADGDWGRKTDTALVKAGLPTVIDAATYSALVGNTQAASPTANEVVANWQGSPLELATKAAQGIAYWVNAADAAGVTTFVHAMRNVSDYTAVNTVFKTIRTANRGGTMASRTLVNALVGDDMPWTAGQKGQFAQELLRMGLKYNNSTDKWSLSGLGGGQIAVRTTTATTVWDAAGNASQVPAGTWLGTAIASGGGYTQVFTRDHRTVFVSTQALATAIL